MGLGAINSAVSKGKCVLIMQMSKFKLGTVEKNHHQTTSPAGETEPFLLRSLCGNSPYLPKNLPGASFRRNSSPPPPLRNLAPL